MTGSRFKLCLVHVTQILFRTCKLIQIKSIFLLCRYKVSFIATDETYNLEFMFLEKRGAELTGKIGDALRKQYTPFDIPPEIEAWIEHKFMSIVSVLFDNNISVIDPLFEVVRIEIVRIDQLIVCIDLSVVLYRYYHSGQRPILARRLCGQESSEESVWRDEDLAVLMWCEAKESCHELA